MSYKPGEGLRVTAGAHVMTVQAGTAGTPAPRFSSESAFWFALRLHLNAHFQIQGKRCDLVKRVMSRDGHMVGGENYPYYLRDRKWAYCIQDTEYAVRDLAKHFNQHGHVVLSITPMEPAK